ncbi:WAT1-related protein At3g28050 [Capsicum annuum]|uniref:WAT1-related protein At3g28050 n=1 Tax=Capsicum annuum TaxID=4072 RepID=UPI001FB06971|nr:WAT1-related protein At3g28050 [Capsicum annuum]
MPSSYAKAFGTIVSIARAFILTFYKGPPIINQHLTSVFSSQQNCILGGVILACESLFTSLWYIIQASILKIYEEEMIVCLYCFFVAIISALVSLVVERNSNAWTLYPDIRLIAILYSGIIGMALRSCMTTWCLKKADPLFVSMFKPLGIVFAVVIGAFCFRDVFYFGSLVGSAIIVVGFYSVIWGKAKEWKEEEKSLRSNNKNMPLLQDKVDDPEVNL